VSDTASPPASSPGPRVRFGVFELDLVTGELRKHGRPVRLQPQPAQVLTLLVARAGELVTREELQEQVWGDDTVVAYDQGLNYCIRQVRTVLGDRAGSPVFVETLPRRGYRFVAPVERLARDDVSESVAESSEGGARRRALWIAAALGATVTLAALLALLGPSAANDPADLQGGPAADKELRLVVLPLLDLSQEPESGAPGTDPYLADSLTEELIVHLSRVAPDRLGIISRVSAMTYKNADKTVEEIGDELGVSHVLEGSVRRAGDRLRVTVQLVRVSDQTHLWAETYDRGFADVLDIQTDIAHRVARALSLRLLPERRDPLVRRTTADPRAYDAFLQGRYEWNRFTRDGYLAAVERFRSALAFDPEYAEAWAAMADAYNLLVFTDAMPQEEAFERAREAARRALELDPELAEAHTSLAFVRLYHDWEPEAAVRDFERALELAPGYAMGHHWAAAAYAALGRFEEAVASARRAAELDPVSLSVRADLGWYHLVAGHWEQALEECTRALDLSPGYGFAQGCRERALLGMGDLEGALEEMRRSLQRQGVPEETAVRLTDPSPALGGPQAALERARDFHHERLQALSDQPGGPGDKNVYALGRAWEWAAVGEPDEAFRWLDRAVDRRDPWMVFLWVDRRFEPLWNDPRFQAVAERVGIARRTSGAIESRSIE